MSNIDYHNTMAEMNNKYYESHLELLKNICIELGAVNKIAEFETKFLNKLKIKQLKDPDKPKKARSSYLFFCQDMRSQLPEDLNTIILQSKKLGALWSAMGDDDRQKYIELSEKDKSRYEDAIQEYQMNK